jgi:hypothetical protein
MKAYRIVQVQLMLVGLGAAMLLARPVGAQQQPDPSRSGVNTLAAQNADVSKNIEAQPVDLEIDEATEADVAPSGFAIQDGLLLLILAVGTGSIFVYAKLATRREWRLQPARRPTQYARVPGAATR